MSMKLSINQYRKGGARVLWIDGRVDEITRRVVSDIRAKGFRCWRTGDQVWVESQRLDDMVAAGVDAG